MARNGLFGWLRGTKAPPMDSAAAWVAYAEPCVCLQLASDGTPDLFAVSGIWAPEVRRADGSVLAPGDTGVLLIERRGADVRFVQFTPEPIDASDFDMLASALREHVTALWDAWDDPAGHHSESAREELSRLVFAAADLGVDVKDLLRIRDHSKPSESWMSLQRPRRASVVLTRA